MKKHKKGLTDEKGNVKTDLAVSQIDDQPISAFDMVNKYGTYNIQPTCDTSNEYPAISQGLPKKPNK